DLHRAIEAASGKQVLQMGSHSDWALSTAFSVKGDHVISGGRDMSVKLTELAEQRFVDNVTSITPGALKGGVLALCARSRGHWRHHCEQYALWHSAKPDGRYADHDHQHRHARRDPSRWGSNESRADGGHVASHDGAHAE
ncbi:MAG TPA: hypothetical protein PK156_50590, partial [Polyangium sp.]|nr:hypothetical protein [Polyangium sp.]